jgi:hypothetical protein
VEVTARKYLNWVRTQPCVCCGGFAQAHHLIDKGDGFMGGKAVDWLAIPLCADHHTGDHGIHQRGTQTWEREYGDQWEMAAKTLLRAIYQGRLRYVD